MNERDPIMLSIALAGLIVAILAWQLPKSTYSSFPLRKSIVAMELGERYSTARPPLPYGGPKETRETSHTIPISELKPIRSNTKTIPADLEGQPAPLVRYADIYGDPEGSIKVEETPKAGGALLRISGPYPASADGPTLEFEFAVLKRKDGG